MTLLKSRGKAKKVTGDDLFGCLCNEDFFIPITTKPLLCKPGCDFCIAECQCSFGIALKAQVERSKMRAARPLLIVVMLIGLARWGQSPAAADSPKPGENLLQDPSFEEYWRWNTWDYSIVVRDPGKGHPMNADQSFGTPYFGPSESKWDKERPRQDEGVAGEVSGEAYWRFRAGYYQTVDAPPGSRVRFSVWVNGFCEDEVQARCPVILKAGIDPSGGYDWQSSSIYWVTTEVADQKYVQLTTEATVGPSGSVTVFTWGEPTFGVVYTAAYFDEASLVILPASTSVQATPVNTLTATPVNIPTATPTIVSASATPSEVATAPTTQSKVTPTPIAASPAGPRSSLHSHHDDEGEDEP